MSEIRTKSILKSTKRVNSVSKKVCSDSHKRIPEKKIIRPSKSCFKASMAVTSSDNTDDKVLNKLGTVDRVIKENNIFTEFAKMPFEIQTTLLQNGWIGKDSSNKMLSLHKNLERVKTVAKRYGSGLIWIDEHSRGVNWSKLRPTVVVNRFPREANAVLKICGQAMAGQSQFDVFYPRAYQAAQVTMDSHFFTDFSLTACVSLLLTFVDGRGVKCTKNGQVPLSALRFAVNACERHDAGNANLPVAGAEWRDFFKYFHSVVDDHKKFEMPADDAELSALTAASRQALDRMMLTGTRRQTAIDGRRNLWTIKCSRLTGQRPFKTNRIDDILKRCDRVRGTAAAADYVVQKYVETPLLVRDDRFDVRAWLVVSTMNDRLTVWLYQTCCVHRRSHRLSVDEDADWRPPPVRSSKSQRHVVHGPVQTCSLRLLKGKLRSAAGDKKRGNSAVYRRIRECLVWSVVAAADTLNLRPNCFELFQATFMVGEDLRPWLIDIESDPWIARDHPHHHAEWSVASGVADSLAKLLVRRGRAPEAWVGMFELLHNGSVPGKPYVRRSFGDGPALKKRNRTKSRSRNKSHHRQDNIIIERPVNDDDISTCVQSIPPDFRDEYYETRNVWFRMDTGKTGIIRINDYQKSLENNLCLNDLRESLNRLGASPKVNVYEAKRCWHLLDRWKKRVMAAQQFYRTLLADKADRKI